MKKLNDFIKNIRYTYVVYKIHRYDKKIKALQQYKLKRDVLSTVLVTGCLSEKEFNNHTREVFVKSCERSLAFEKNKTV